MTPGIARVHTCSTPQRCVRRQYHLPGSLVSNANCTVQYGLPDNTSRPGGPLEFARFHSKNTSSTFMMLADKSTVSSLIGTVRANCSSYLSMDNTSSSPTPYTNQSTEISPEKAVQYF